jgi:hypothetical protein
VDNAICEVNYSIVWANKPGYTTPPPESKPLPYEGSITFHGIYIPVPETNIIQINSSPEGASFILKGPTTYTGTTPRKISNAPVGTYTLTWQPMPGYLTPSPQTVTMEEGGSWSGTIVYTPMPDSGYISVTSNKPNASFSLIGPTNFNDRTVPFNSSAPVGSYTINWNEISGYTKPPSQTKTVSKDLTTNFYGEYTLASQPVEYALSIGTSGQGTTSPAPGVWRYSPGTQVSITASASPGWEFAYWGADAKGNSLSTTVIMDCDKTVIAYFRQVSTPTYSLSTSVDPPGSGYVGRSPDSGTYAATTPVIITAYPNQGWKFDRWGVDATGTSIQTTVTMNSNKNITAYFTRSETPAEKYNLSTYVEPSGGGYISPSDGTYDKGTQVTLTANAYPGWEFDYWGGAAQGKSTSTTIVMSSNTSVTAYFTQLSKEKYGLSTYINPSNSSGTISFSPSSLSYDQGTQVTLTAKANPGWEFAYWGGDAAGTSTSTTIIMNSNKSVTAYFITELSSTKPTVDNPKWTGNFYDDPVQMILARAIFGEARGESRDGKIAVGWVIRNRAENGRWWGTDYHSVILKPQQFSAFNQGDPNRPLVENPLYRNSQQDREAWYECYQMAGQVLNNQVVDPTKRADHFYSLSIPKPSWADEAKFTVQIGNHKFYRLELSPPGIIASAQQATTSIVEGVKNIVNNVLNALGFNTPLSDKVVELARSQIDCARASDCPKRECSQDIENLASKLTEEQALRKTRGESWVWAEGQATYCHRFAHAVVVVAYFGEFKVSPTRGYDNAWLAYSDLLNQKKIQNIGQPPKGSLVFYDYYANGENLGHVGIADGEGYIIGVCLSGTVESKPLKYPGTPLGWISACDYIKYRFPAEKLDCTGQ